MGCPISSKSVIFGLDPKIYFITIQEIAVSKHGNDSYLLDNPIKSREGITVTVSPSPETLRIDKISCIPAELSCRQIPSL